MTVILRKEKYPIPDGDLDSPPLKGVVEFAICRHGDKIYARAKAIDSMDRVIERHEEEIDPAPGKSMEKVMTAASRSVILAAKSSIERVSEADKAAAKVEI